MNNFLRIKTAHKYLQILIKKISLNSFVIYKKKILSASIFKTAFEKRFKSFKLFLHPKISFKLLSRLNLKSLRNLFRIITKI